MIVVRILSLTFILILMLSLQSCLQVEPTVGGESTSLNQKFQGTGQSYVFLENPIIASGNANLSIPNMKDYVSPAFITNNAFLEDDCTFSSKTSSTSSISITTATPCFNVLQNSSPTTQLLPTLAGGWGYNIGSDEFYQVTTFYHTKKFINKYLKDMKSVHSNVHFSGNALSIPSATKYDFYLTKSFWFGDNGVNKTLSVFSKCVFPTEDFNAYFSPSDNTVCLGWTDKYDFLHAAQDPSVIYHELGHVLVKIMMNQRNTLAQPTMLPTFHSDGVDSNLGSLFYDEAGSINEGISDYFSYYMNGRFEMGEWALGRYYDSARPMQETSSIHSIDVDTTEDKRLSYPQNLYYNSGDTSKNYEDVHFAGQIVSHYLVSLTEKFKNVCTFPTNNSGLNNADYKHSEANKLTLLLLSETLAEIGDLTARGSDLFDIFRFSGLVSDTKLQSFFTNLNPQESFLWTHQVNPPNFRRFFQIFGKNILFKVSPNFCSSFTQDVSETLLDNYGLLLFKSYQDNKAALNYTDEAGTNATDITYWSEVGGGVNIAGTSDNVFITPFGNTMVNEINRRKSVLVSKDFISLAPTLTGQAVAYVFDKRSDIESLLTSLKFKGEVVQTSDGLAGVQYNNGNIKISPGEILGVTLNLYNNSNSTMGGVQILANDWDHMKLNDATYNYVSRDENIIASNNVATWEPCQVAGWPLLSEGAVTDSDDTIPGNCSYTTRSNYIIDENASQPKYYPDASQPICMVQYNDDDETKWVSQDFYRKVELGIEDNNCLNNPAMSYDSFNPNECLVRFLPSANQATLGKISAQKTYGQSLIGTSTDHEGFQSNSALVMEVSKLVNPETIFNCRMRVRFTNCSDCYLNDLGEEYKDYEFSSSDPFKVINFQFKVQD